MSWNAGSLTTAVWEELLSILRTPPYRDVKLVAIQETHWRGSWQFSRDGWNVVSSGSLGEKGAGVLIMVHSTLCKQQEIRFNEILPGRVLHVRIPGKSFSLDAISCYQYVWRSKENLQSNKDNRSSLLRKLGSSIRGMPQRNTLLVMGDFNMSLRSDMKYVGPSTIPSCRLGHKGSKELHQLLEEHQLTATNTWCVRKPATHAQGNSVSQIDYALLRLTQAKGPGKATRPQRDFPVAQWREGSRHFPLMGHIRHCRAYSAQVPKRYDQQRMEDCYRRDRTSIEAYRQQVELSLEPNVRSWKAIRDSMASALEHHFPRQRRRNQLPTSANWEHRRSLRSLPVTLQALSDMHSELKQRIVLRCWRSLITQGKEARLAKAAKKAKRQEEFDQCLHQAAQISNRDGGHSLYKVIRSFRQAKPQERVQLRDSHGNFLTSKEEVKQLRGYSEELFGEGQDFPMTGLQGDLCITAQEVQNQLATIKVGKAVPRDCPPIVAWRSLGPQAHQRIADILNHEVVSKALSASVTSSQISWLPKPPKKPDKPESLRPIGVIAPEGKILAGLVRRRLKPVLKSAMSGLAQFGFVPGRGTEEAICKALTHVDEARQRAAASRKIPGRGHGGLKLQGSLTLSVDMSKAFDTVDRVRLREALEEVNTDPFLVEVVGMLHIEALYDMTASETKFSVATKRGIKQGCKLAPSLFAFVTGLLYRKLANQITQDELARLLTMYADDILLQSHFDSLDALTRALDCCDLLLDQLTALGFRVNPTKSALLLQLHGGSAVTARRMLMRKMAGDKFVSLPSGRLISYKTQVPYLGIILSYQDYEMRTLAHRLKASKAAMAEVAHAVRNHRVLSECRRKSIWTITAWASALYSLHVVGVTQAGLNRLQSHMVYQLRFVLRSYSQETRETNQELLRRSRVQPAQQQLQKRMEKFIQRQIRLDSELCSLYLPRARRLQTVLRNMSAEYIPTSLREQRIACEDCGAVFQGSGALRRHRIKQHPDSSETRKGPKFDPIKHSVAGTCNCSACGAVFSTTFFLRRHVELSTCPRVELLLRVEEELPIEVQTQQNAIVKLREAAKRDPEDSARRPEFHSAFMESCILCGQAASAQKGIKQHLHKQHPGLMQAVEDKLPARLHPFKVLMHKGDQCRYCHLRIDAPGRHVQQCAPLLQSHIVQEADRMKLDLRPRDYVPKARNKPDKGGTQTSQPTSSIGTSSSSFRLQGFLLLGNTRNHCYANAVLQCVYWISAHVREHMLREATRVSQLVRITPEHSALSTVTSGWHFDGGQHDAAEFLLRMSRNLAPHFQNSWETRKEVPEGVIVDEEGSLPIHIDVPLQDSLQQIICSWARQEHTHALLPSPDVVCVSLPRFTGGEKDLRAIQLEPSVSVPFFHSSTPEVTWEEYSLEALIIHQGPSADSGHYRAAVRAGDEWYLGDDALAPSACALNDSLLTTGSYLLFLKQVRAAPPVIVVE